MKAIVFTDRNKVELTDLPDPTPGPNEVVVEVKASGICHTGTIRINRLARQRAEY